MKYTRKLKRKYKRKTQRLIGGRVLGEGSFGCVLSPFVKCRNVKLSKKQSSKNTVSKIILNPDEDDLQELTLSNMIKKLDPDMKYFITNYGACKILKFEDRPDIEKIQLSNSNSTAYYELENESKLKLKDKKRCKVDEDKEPINIIMPYGGLELTNILKKHSKNKLYNQINNIIIKNIKGYLQQMLEALQILHNNRIVHRDIKPDNTLCKFDATNKTVGLRIIDFGLSEKITSNYESISLNGTIEYIAPEIVITYCVEDNSRELFNRSKLLGKINNEYIHRKKKYNRYLRKMQKLGLDNNIAKYNDNFAKLFDKIVVEYQSNLLHNKYFNVNDVLNSYLAKSDVYSLGITFFEICEEHNKLNIANNKPQLYDLLKKMIAFNPNDRLNVKECLEHPFLA